jgi:ketosteroid isomerase-like protein
MTNGSGDFWQSIGCESSASTLDPGLHSLQMSVNKKMVGRYMDGFGRSDHEQVLSCLTDDVEWEIPGMFHVRGKEAFDKHIENEGFVDSPAITVSRLTEEDNVVVAEGLVRTQRKDGTFLNLAFCDVFELEGGKIRRLISYLMETK